MFTTNNNKAMFIFHPTVAAQLTEDLVSKINTSWNAFATLETSKNFTVDLQQHFNQLKVIIVNINAASDKDQCVEALKALQEKIKSMQNKHCFVLKEESLPPAARLEAQGVVTNLAINLLDDINGLQKTLRIEKEEKTKTPESRQINESKPERIVQNRDSSKKEEEVINFHDLSRKEMVSFLDSLLLELQQEKDTKSDVAGVKQDSPEEIRKAREIHKNIKDIIRGVIDRREETKRDIADVKRELAKPNFRVNHYERGEEDAPVLVHAAMAGSFGILKAILEAKADVNLGPFPYSSPLVQVVTMIGGGNRSKCLKELIKQPGIDLNAQSHNGYTALMRAVIDQNVTAIRDLLQAGAAVSGFIEADYWNDALLFAIRVGNTGIVKLILDEARVQIDFTVRDRDGYTPLMNAVLKQNKPMIRYLLEAGAPVDKNVLSMAKQKGMDKLISRPIVNERKPQRKLESKPSVPESYSQKSLYEYGYNYRPFYLSKGVDDSPDSAQLIAQKILHAIDGSVNGLKDGQKISYVERQLSKPNCDIDYIIDYGNDDKYAGYPMLFYAALKGEPGIMRLLLEHDAKPDVNLPQGRDAWLTPLMATVIELTKLDRKPENRRTRERYIECFHQLLAEKKLDLNAQDVNGYTALMHAVSRNDIALAEALIKRGAAAAGYTDIVTGEDALVLAIKKGNQALIDVVVRAYAKLNSDQLEALINKYRLEGHPAEEARMRLARLAGTKILDAIPSFDSDVTSVVVGYLGLFKEKEEAVNQEQPKNTTKPSTK